MRVGERAASCPRGAPYRVPGEVPPSEAPAPPARAGAETLGILTFVLGCSLLRFGLFVFRPERFGVDPALALAASAASAYTLARVLAR